MKRKIAYIMAVIMSMSVFSAAFAGTASAADYKFDLSDFSMLENLGLTKDDAQYPTIILPGINNSITFHDANGNGIRDEGEPGGGIFVIDDDFNTGRILSIVFKIFPALIINLATQDDTYLCRKLYEVASDIFEYMATDDEGIPLDEKLTLIKYHDPDISVAEMSPKDRDSFYGLFEMEACTKMPYNSEPTGTLEDLTYIYCFPLVGDPMESAIGLKEMIDRLAPNPGDKVNIVPISLGGTLLTAYMQYVIDEFGGDFSKINSIVNIVAVLNGTGAIDGFYTRGPEGFNLTDKFFFTEFFPMIMGEMNNGDKTMGYLLNIFLKLIPRSGFEHSLTAIYSGVFDSLFINCPQFWAMMSKETFGDIDGNGGLFEKYNLAAKPVLAAKLLKFQEARWNLAENLQNAADTYGVSVSMLAGYNLTFTDGEYNYFGVVNASKTANADAVVDIGSTTLGAMSAPAKKKIDTSKIPGFDPKYLSPDGSIYLGTCAFPDNVWVFYNQHHEVGRNDIVIRTATALITGYLDGTGSAPDVFPQFNNNARHTKNLTRDLFFKAEDVLNGKWDAPPIDRIGYPIINPEKPYRYSDAQKIAMQTVYGDQSGDAYQNLLKAYNDAVDMLNTTTYPYGKNPAAIAQSVQNELRLALYNVSPDAPLEWPAGQPRQVSFLERFMEFVSGVIQWRIPQDFYGGWLKGAGFEELFS
ncbi:MAG: hypothetical protein FWF08_01385 [Oscillospiraceae bacterium]|nr:hypothetical protein [Oscillospiraceae bacterium]